MRSFPVTTSRESIYAVRLQASCRTAMACYELPITNTVSYLAMAWFNNLVGYLVTFLNMYFAVSFLKIKQYTPPLTVRVLMMILCGSSLPLPMNCRIEIMHVNSKQIYTTVGFMNYNHVQMSGENRSGEKKS